MRCQSIDQNAKNGKEQTAGEFDCPWSTECKAKKKTSETDAMLAFLFFSMRYRGRRSEIRQCGGAIALPQIEPSIYVPFECQASV